MVFGLGSDVESFWFLVFFGFGFFVFVLRIGILRIVRGVFGLRLNNLGSTLEGRLGFLEVCRSNLSI